MIGAVITVTGMPASLRARTVSSRRWGVAARGSILRQSVRSSVVIETPARTSPFAAIGASRSRNNFV